jgi:diguanylate cyclase (GGDEF)-like protein
MLEDLAQMVVDKVEPRRLVSLDSLTGALTCRSFYRQARRDVARSGGLGQPLSCAVIDIDNLREINHTHSHAAGDLLLQRTVSVCLSQLRTAEYIGRIGGDEFGLILPDTVLLRAFEIADQMREAITASVIDVSGRRVFASVSIGIAELLTREACLDRLLGNADAALYDAKLDGKDRVACHLDDLRLATGGPIDPAYTTAGIANGPPARRMRN